MASSTRDARTDHGPRRVVRWSMAVAGALLLLLLPLGAVGQDLPEPTRSWDIPFVVEDLGPGLSVLWVPGAIQGSFVGNVAVLAGEEGSLVVDGGLPLVSPALRRKIEEQAPGGVQVLVNTHPHADHVGGNDYFRARGARVYARRSTLPILSSPDFVELLDTLGMPAPERERHLPTHTVPDGRVVELTWAGERVRLVPVPPAHTPADLVVHFVDRNVVHMGDLFVDGFPFFDSGRGGTLDGVVAAADTALALLGWEEPSGWSLGISDDGAEDPPERGATLPPVVVRGHGRLSDARALREYRDMLAAVRDSVGAMLEAGRTEDEAAAAALVRELTLALPGSYGRPDLFVRRVYASLKGRRAPTPQPGGPAPPPPDSSR